jgi:hypothetical protein
MSAVMEDIKKLYGYLSDEFRIEPEKEYYPYEDGYTINWNIECWREETDEEFEERKALAEKIEADREARERKQFLELSKKFGDKK